MRYICTTTLPDGRRIDATQHGYVEWDTNAFVETGDMALCWSETGEPLTDEEMESVMPDGSFLHEWISHHGDWEIDDAWGE